MLRARCVSGRLYSTTIFATPYCSPRRLPRSISSRVDASNWASAPAGTSPNTSRWASPSTRPEYVSVVWKSRRGCPRSEEHTSELQSRLHLVCRLLLEKKKTTNIQHLHHS